MVLYFIFYRKKYLIWTSDSSRWGHEKLVTCHLTWPLPHPLNWDIIVRAWHPDFLITTEGNTKLYYLFLIFNYRLCYQSLLLQATSRDPNHEIPTLALQGTSTARFTRRKANKTIILLLLLFKIYKLKEKKCFFNIYKNHNIMIS